MNTAWSWHPHWAAWALLVVGTVAVLIAHRRLQRTAAHPAPWTFRQRCQFAGAVVVAAVALTWPVADLATKWALCALVLQRTLLAIAVAPLLLSGLPIEVVGALTRPGPVDAMVVRFNRPKVAVFAVTALLVLPMLPVFVVAQAHSPIVRAVFDLVALIAGFILWIPIIGRIPGVPRPRPMARLLYLVAQSVVPVFLSFIFILAVHPLYPTFSHSADVIGLSPLGDQQVAGFVSKLSFLLTLLIVAGLTLAGTPDSDDDLGPEDPLVWSDVERHFERVDRKARGSVQAGVALAAESPKMAQSVADDGPGLSEQEREGTVELATDTETLPAGDTAEESTSPPDEGGDSAGSEGDR